MWCLFKFSLSINVYIFKLFNTFRDPRSYLVSFKMSYTDYCLNVILKGNCFIFFSLEITTHASNVSNYRLIWWKFRLFYFVVKFRVLVGYRHLFLYSALLLRSISWQLIYLWRISSNLCINILRSSFLRLFVSSLMYWF